MQNHDHDPYETVDIPDSDYRVILLDGVYKGYYNTLLPAPLD